MCNDIPVLTRYEPNALFLLSKISDSNTFITLLKEILGWCERIVFPFVSYSNGSGQKGQRKTGGNRKRKLNQTEPDTGDHSHFAQMIIEVSVLLSRHYTFDILSNVIYIVHYRP